MGRELIIDAWLLDQVDPHDDVRAPAVRLLRAQLLVFLKTGHLISYADQLPRREIRKALALDKLPRIYCRCMRCGTNTWLSDWMVAAEFTANEMGLAASRLRAESGAHRVRFLEPCEGYKHALHLANLYDWPIGDAQIGDD